MKNLVLFWGWSHDAKDYHHLVDSAPKEWKIYNIPYPELLPSKKIGFLSDRVLKFLEDNNLDKVYLMGHSLGGALAIKFASQHPQKVEQLFLADSIGVYTKDSFIQTVKNVLTPCPHSNEKAATGTHTFLNFLKHPLMHLRLAIYAYYCDVQKEAEKITVPTKIFWGEKDRIVPLWKGKKLNSLIKDSKLTIFPDEGHDWILHTPKIFWDKIV